MEHNDMILVSIDDHVIEPRDMFDAHVPGGWKIDKITWQNTCRFFGYEPFTHIDREVATVGALRDQAQDVDTTIRTKQAWRALYEAQAN